MYGVMDAGVAPNTTSIANSISLCGAILVTLPETSSESR